MDCFLAGFALLYAHPMGDYKYSATRWVLRKVFLKYFKFKDLDVMAIEFCRSGMQASSFHCRVGHIICNTPNMLILPNEILSDLWGFLWSLYFSFGLDNKRSIATRWKVWLCYCQRACDHVWELIEYCSWPQRVKACFKVEEMQQKRGKKLNLEPWGEIPKEHKKT